MKRSITIAGHRTSISMEPEFWTALKQICQSRNMTIPQLVAEIDHNRGGRNLSSAIRVFTLEHFRSAPDQPK